MTNLTILDTQIRSLDNLYSLTDLHRSSGGEDKHLPNRFMRLDTTQELISEINSQTPDLASGKISHKIIRGGTDLSIRGYWVCEELVLSYAMWISPKFHLVVLRAFLAMHRNEPKQLALPEPEKKYSRELTKEQWLRFASMWYALYNNLELLSRIHKPLEMPGSHYGVTAYTHVTEYQTTLGVMKRMLEPMLAEFNVDPREEAHYYHALKTLREYQPRGLAKGAII